MLKQSIGSVTLGVMGGVSGPTPTQERSTEMPRNSDRESMKVFLVKCPLLIEEMAGAS